MGASGDPPDSLNSRKISIVTKTGTTQRTVAVALDDNMVHAFFVLVHSLLSHAQGPFHLIVGHFTGRLAATNEELIRQFLSELGVSHDIRELTPSPLFTERRHLTITTFSKFVISDAVPAAHLWIDLDTVAKPGWDDIFTPLHSASSDIALVVAAKIDSPHTRFSGFNAGVLGWTTAPRQPWQEELKNLPEKRFSSEQHLFNTLYMDNHHVVDVRYNFLSSWHANVEELERASIVHYSGPIKPWHLPRRHRRAWQTINPSWEAWFEAEDALLSATLNPDTVKRIRRGARQALTSGRLHTGKGALAGWFLRFLAIAGPLGQPFVTLLSRRAAR